MIDRRKFYIDGAWVDATAGRDHLVIDPSTGEPCAVISLAGRADVDASVAAAKAVFPGWMRTPPAERIACVERFLEVYQARMEDVARAVSLEMGAPITLARNAHAPLGVRHTQNFLRAVRSFDFSRPLGEEWPETRIVHEPIGVCVLITPWNWPLNQISLKVIAALLAGCTMILKPSEESPLSAAVFAECIHAAGMPDGVFNLVNGDGAGTGTMLTAHPDVDMVSFTGSTRAGIAISKSASNTLKRVALELGGKGANIVFADADAAAVERGVRQMMNNTGQSCNAPSRMLVQSSIYAQAVARAVEVAGAVTVGPSGAEGTHIGPVVNGAQWAKIQGLIQTGIDEGARLVAGGLGRPEGFNRGFYVRPTVFADVGNDMTIAREEIFGPVMSMMPFETEDEAIGIANDSVYGLANYVQTQDGERANRVALALRSGMVEINGKPRGPGSPFGGMKQSGNGREGGVWGLQEFMEVKAVGGWTR
ncbi:aldehyde dehydrogenase family protein [Mesorhizobium sp. ASY16-5R]|uniref:aldehyde dehydrogenase family protein n=1 Tax=Mesorhizobium sp. ASY16-5R TaxID=3445772 RepID=UPI003F9F9B93